MVGESRVMGLAFAELARLVCSRAPPVPRLSISSPLEPPDEVQKNVVLSSKKE